MGSTFSPHSPVSNTINRQRSTLFSNWFSQKGSTRPWTRGSLEMSSSQSFLHAMFHLLTSQWIQLMASIEHAVSLKALTIQTISTNTRDFALPLDTKPHQKLKILHLLFSVFRFINYFLSLLSFSKLTMLQSQNWQNGLGGCCSPLDSCLLSTCLPCISKLSRASSLTVADMNHHPVFGRTSQRLDNPSGPIVSMNSDCAIFCAIQSFTGFGWM